MIGLGINISTPTVPSEISQLLSQLKSRATYFENASGTTEILTDLQTCSF